MVDRIQKVLKRLTLKQQKSILEAVKKIRANDLRGLDLKKLSGRDDIYRVRQGDFRIIFRRVSQAENAIIAIERKTDTTYNAF